MYFTQYNDRAWGLIRTRPCHEKKVHAYLLNSGVPCYLPVVHTGKPHSRVRRIPMFRCYLFAAWNVMERAAMSNCSSITHRFGTPLHGDESIMRQMEMLHNIERFSETRAVNLEEELPQAEGVKMLTIKSGLLAGCRGNWKILDGRKYFALSLNLLDSFFEITFAGDGLELV